MKHRTLTDDLYDLLVEDEDARVCRDIPEGACDSQPLSFVCQMAAQSLTNLGDALVSPKLMLPWMLTSVGAAHVVALLIPVRESLSLLPQLFIASAIRRHETRKPFWIVGALGQALAIVAMLAALLAAPPGWTGILVVLALAAFSLSRGVCSVAAKDVLGKTVSKTRRGRLTGYATAASGVTTIIAAAVIASDPSHWFPGEEAMVFALILGVAAMCWLVAVVVYARIPEIPGATEGGGNAFTEAIASLGLMRTDKALRDFVITRALLVSLALAVPFMVVVFQKNSERGFLDLGVLLFAQGLAAMLSGPFWGRWSDSASHHVMAIAAAAGVTTLAVAIAIMTFWQDLLGLPVVTGTLLFISTVSHQGIRVSRKTYLVDIAHQQNRAQYTAVSNTLIGVILALTGVFGLVDARFGTVVVLNVLAVIGIIGMVTASRLQHAT